MGDSYQEVLPQLSDDEYSDAGEAFLKTIGYERRAVVYKVSSSRASLSLESDHWPFLLCGYQGLQLLIF